MIMVITAIAIVLRFSELPSNDGPCYSYQKQRLHTQITSEEIFFETFG